MDSSLFYTSSQNKLNGKWLIPTVLVAAVLGKLIAGTGILAAGFLIALPFMILFLVSVFLNPKVGFIAVLAYCYIMPVIGRYIPGLQVGLGTDALMILTWLGIIFYRGNRFRWRHLNNDLVWVTFSWFALTILEIANPDHPNIQGWLQEMRSLALYWMLLLPLVFFVMNKRTDINLFLNIIIAFSIAGSIWGFKQLKIGLDAAETVWLHNGHLVTHLLFGKLRVFSYYMEAGQFGASQAHLTLICIILALGPYKIGKKIWYAIAALIIFYGMMISGTRGAIGGLVLGGFVFLILSKQVRIIVIGMIFGAAFIGMLKFTKIGNQNDQIKRMRSSTDPNDPSLQLRLMNQKRLKEILKTKPFGSGLGSIGAFSSNNKHIAISRIPPDSLFVKIWGEYGVIGFTTWLGILMYIMGKSIGIVWKTRDPVLRNQLTALCAGSFSIIVCSYGNEVMNCMPSTAIVYISWALIWLSPRWDIPLQNSLTVKNDPIP